MVDMTADALSKICKELKLYRTPELNDKLYLHYHGFQCIEGLDAWIGLRALWLEGNGFTTNPAGGLLIDYGGSNNAQITCIANSFENVSAAAAAFSPSSEA